MIQRCLFTLKLYFLVDKYKKIPPSIFEHLLNLCLGGWMYICGVREKLSIEHRYSLEIGINNQTNMI